MSSISKQKNSGLYRVRFRIDNRQKEVSLPTGDKRKAQTIANMIDKLVERQKTGLADPDLTRWLASIPEDLQKRLARVDLIEAKQKPKTIQNLIDIMGGSKDVTKRTLSTYNMTATNLVDFFGAETELNEITVEMAEKYVRYLQTAAYKGRGQYRTGNSNKGLSIATVKRRIGMTKQFFKKAVELDWLIKSPFRFQQGGDVVNKTRWQYLNVETIERVLDVTTNPKHRAEIALMRFAGVRGASEMYQMTWGIETIRWSEKNVPGSITILADKTKRHEGKESRIVPLPPILENCLRALYEQAPEGQVKMFPTTRKESNPGVCLQKCFNAAGVEVGMVYNLRRSYCCDVMQTCGSDAKAYEELTGHSFSMGLKHYQILHEERRVKATEKMLNFFGEESVSKFPHKFPHIFPTNSPLQDGVENCKGKQKVLQTLTNMGVMQTKNESCNSVQNANTAIQGLINALY